MWLSSQPANMWEYESGSWGGKRKTDSTSGWPNSGRQKNEPWGSPHHLKRFASQYFAKCGIWRRILACTQHARDYCKQGTGVWDEDCVESHAAGTQPEETWSTLDPYQEVTRSVFPKVEVCRLISEVAGLKMKSLCVQRLRFKYSFMA